MDTQDLIDYIEEQSWDATEPMWKIFADASKEIADFVFDKAQELEKEAAVNPKYIQLELFDL